jgi:hypothetical protein
MSREFCGCGNTCKELKPPGRPFCRYHDAYKSLMNKLRYTTASVAERDEWVVGKNQLTGMGAVAYNERHEQSGQRPSHLPTEQDERKSPAQHTEEFGL